MGKRGHRMGIRGKPGILLVCLLTLVVIVIIYYFQSTRTVLIHDHHGYKKTYNIGNNNNFDPSKFIQNPKTRINVEKNKHGELTVPDLPKDRPKSDDSKLDKERFDDEEETLKPADKDHSLRLLPNNVIRNKFANQFPRDAEETRNGDDTQTENLVTQPPKNEIEKLYRKPDSEESFIFKDMKHIVHLDFKGAPPKLDYLNHILPLMTSLGATGLLVEYEDIFPYSESISTIAAGNAFTQSEFIKFLAMANQMKLEIIPLVQMFGHLEFVLKYEKYAYLREVFDTPQAISPALNDSYILLQTMIDQIVTSHPAIQYLHLGCDEVYDLGKGQSAKYMEERGFNKSRMFFEHISRLVMYIKEKYPQVTPIVWDDQFRMETLDTIQSFGIGNILEPMIWSYPPHPQDRFSDEVLEKYGKAFKHVWAASSFKGATGSAQYYTNITHHLSNHLGWIDIITKSQRLAPNMKFRGIAMTGWQRYDHFATLCELLPSAIPSMAVCLATIANGGYSEIEHKNVKKVLGCSDNLLTRYCSFPGSDFYNLIVKFKKFENGIANYGQIHSRLEGWLTDYNIDHGYGSPGQLKVLNNVLNVTIYNYTVIGKELSTTMSQYYDVPTVEEWIAVHIDQKVKRFKERMSVAKTLMKRKYWPRRPFTSQSHQSDINQNQIQGNQQLRNNQPINLQPRNHGVELNQFNPNHIINYGPRNLRNKQIGFDPDGKIQNINSIDNNFILPKNTGLNPQQSLQNSLNQIPDTIKSLKQGLSELNQGQRKLQLGKKLPHYGARPPNNELNKPHNRLRLKNHFKNSEERGEFGRNENKIDAGFRRGNLKYKNQ